MTTKANHQILSKWLKRATSIQTLIVEPRTPELAICARWRANAFSVLKASFEQELRSLELFASDQSHGVVLVAKEDGEPVGT